jgi:hypothetical protein
MVMSDMQRLKLLRMALVLVGVICLLIYPLMLLWPSGWSWHEGYSDYPLMIVGVYATLGVFLIRAARDPLANLSLIWFTVFSSLVHGAIMAAQSFMHPMHMGHLVGDVPALFIAAILLAWLAPRSTSTPIA